MIPCLSQGLPSLCIYVAIMSSPCFSQRQERINVKAHHISVLQREKNLLSGNLDLLVGI